jgi:L(+)-tartrate dehydratase beta subunit
MWVPRVENFGPLIVESDLKGNSLFEQQNAWINQRFAMLYEGLKEPALRRHGETDDKTEELIQGCTKRQ